MRRASAPASPPAARAALALAAAGGAAALATATWGIGIERHLYALRRASAEVLPRGAAPIRILHLSDMHLAPWQHHRARWVSELAGLAPDLVVNTGDSLGHADALPAVRSALDPFRGIPGVYVHGSNDLYAPTPRNPLRYFLGPSQSPPEPEPLDTAALDEYLSGTLGWHPLDNATARLEVAGRTVDAIGAGDAHHDLDDLDAVARLAQRLPRRRAPLRIGVTHAPYAATLNALADASVDVLFAGHTHGGQVRVPGIGALVANCDIPLDQARGLSTWRRDGRRLPLNVSAGLGHSIYAPIRFACRPEATLLTLVARGGADSEGGRSSG